MCEIAKYSSFDCFEITYVYIRNDNVFWVWIRLWCRWLWFCRENLWDLHEECALGKLPHDAGKTIYFLCWSFRQQPKLEEKIITLLTKMQNNRPSQASWAGWPWDWNCILPRFFVCTLFNVFLWESLCSPSSNCNCSGNVFQMVLSQTCWQPCVYYWHVSPSHTQGNETQDARPQDQFWLWNRLSKRQRLERGVCPSSQGGLPCSIFFPFCSYSFNGVRWHLLSAVLEQVWKRGRNARSCPPGFLQQLSPLLHCFHIVSYKSN